MCGLFGLSRHGGEIKNLADLTHSLAVQSAVRGTDATGIAFCDAGTLKIQKESKPACNFEIKHSDKICALTGHTRHSTQGSQRKVYNNHPFPGRCSTASFALSHNGVLSNDRELRKKYRLPKTRVETDSFVAVQLIESQRKLNFDSIRFMAEKTEGSFSYSILDDKNNIWLVKGDSPLSILHFPKLKIYVYASTDEILYKALVDSPLFPALKKGEFEVIEISEGEILKITPKGKIERENFEFSYFCGKAWWEYNSFMYHDSYGRNEYIDDLKAIASYNGISPDCVDELITAGFSFDEIEDYIYCSYGGEI